ncbi:transglycosylase SLT domain-containing protein [Pseudoduganella sp. LjRoot289]|uniref:lytic transglycosylase domain-containing protein n=1 Tax=Pseudoduganella sp. LjRoot289 TaxID=3342314 RepID=UPI003ECE3C17
MARFLTIKTARLAPSAGSAAALALVLALQSAYAGTAEETAAGAVAGTATGSVAAAPSGALAAELRAAAVRLEHGEGLPRDLPQALGLYCRAARLGDTQAQYALGWMLANGRGTPRDDGAAAQLFALAAAQGHPQAQAMLQATNTAPNTPLPACMLPDTPFALLPPEPRVLYPQPGSKQIGAMVEQLAPQFEIDPRLAMAIISVESGFNTRALSPKNAQGLMQLIPETAERFRVKDAFDAEQNIRGGLAYLRWLLAYFRGDVQLVAAAYNAGEKAVDQHKGVPPYAETQEYVKRVARLYKHAIHPYQRGLTSGSALNQP